MHHYTFSADSPVGWTIDEVLTILRMGHDGHGTVVPGVFATLREGELVPSCELNCNHPDGECRIKLIDEQAEQNKPADAPRAEHIVVTTKTTIF